MGHEKIHHRRLQVSVSTSQAGHAHREPGLQKKGWGRDTVTSVSKSTIPSIPLLQVPGDRYLRTEAGVPRF